MNHPTTNAYVKEVMETFTVFANRNERIYKKEDWTGATSDNAIFIIWAEYYPSKNTTNVNINYHYQNAGSEQFNIWLERYHLKMEWIEPAVAGIYPTLKPTIYTKQPPRNTPLKIKQRITDYNKAIFSNDFNNEDKKFINKQLGKIREKYGYSLPVEIINIIKSYLFRYTPKIFLINYHSINSMMTDILYYASLEEKLSNFMCIYVREAFFTKYLKSPENNRYDIKFSNHYKTIHKTLGCVTYILIFNETETQFSCLFLTEMSYSPKISKWFTTIKTNINKHSIMANEIYCLILETLYYHFSKPITPKHLKDIPAKDLNAVKTILDPYIKMRILCKQNK